MVYLALSHLDITQKKIIIVRIRNVFEEVWIKMINVSPFSIQWCGAIISFRLLHKYTDRKNII